MEKFFQMSPASLIISAIGNSIGLSKNLRRKQNRIHSFQNNRRPYAAKSTRQKLLDPEQITVPHPPYSSDLVSTDRLLYCSLSNN